MTIAAFLKILKTSIMFEHKDKRTMIVKVNHYILCV